MKRPSTDKPELLRWLQMQGEADRRLLAQLWDLPPESDVPALAAALADPERVRRQWEQLTEPEQAAMTRVLQAGGALPVAIVQRDFGLVRDPAHFANPRAYLQALGTPASPAERLFTMGLLIRDHDARGQVFRVLSDLRRLLPAVPPRDLRLRVAPADAPSEFRPAEVEMAERTLLALLTLADEDGLAVIPEGALNKASLVRLSERMGFGKDLKGVRREANWPWVAVLRPLAVEAGLLRATTDGVLHVGPEALGWLRKPRAERVRQLLDAWVESKLNELTLLCALTWRSMSFGIDLREARRTVLAMIRSLPAGEWFSLPALMEDIERVDLDFLRRDGRFDTGLIYDERGTLRSGREHWQQVEGRFLRAALRGVLHWLGMTDVAAGDGEAELIRLTPLAAHLLQGVAPPPEAEPEPLVVQGTFEVICPPGAALLARFQLGRVAEQVSVDEAAIFKLTRRGIVVAAERGISAEDVLGLLQEHGRGPVPQGVATYIREWGEQHGQLQIEEAVLLRGADPVRLLEVRRTRGVDLQSVEELTPTTWKLAPGDAPALIQQLERAGWSVTGDKGSEGKASARRQLSEHDLKALVTAAYAYAHMCAELDLPCEVSSAMLQRLQKLVPSRHVERAWVAARELRGQLREREASTQPEAQRREAQKHA